jgi:hypothetical protein
MVTRRAIGLALALAAAGAAAAGAASTGPAPGGAVRAAGGAGPRAATVSIDPTDVVARFRPDRALGAGLDGHGAGETAQIYTPANARAMAGAGLRAISYRLRTELGVEDWHWSPAGRFSGRTSGYWTSPSPAGAAVAATYGYRLPRRGDTVDQANDSGYSRLDDGSRATYWKSNPYLDPHFTGERHPQWVLVDLGRGLHPVDGVRIHWGAPYARRLRVQFWVGPSAVYLSGDPAEHWTDFPQASFRGRPSGRSGAQTLRLAPSPVGVRFVRVLLDDSSHTGPAGSRDVRDRLGFAIRELEVGSLTGTGAAGDRLVDLVRHAPSHAQTVTYASSTDPWHAAGDRDPQTEQPSFATVLASGLTSRRPVLVPVGVLYGTPANAVAELRYLRSRHVRLQGVELGEEPDGQLASPEDYGALYLEFARAIHRAMPGLPVGGPGFQSTTDDWFAWPNRLGDTSWTGRFVAYLQAHHALRDLSFFSFEWYPFDDTCGDPAAQLAGASGTLQQVLRAQAGDGLPAGIRRVMTEYGYSSFSGRAEVDLPGALLDADVVGGFLAAGGAAAYLYGYEPEPLLAGPARCHAWGNLTLLLSDGAHRIRQPTASYWAVRLLTRAWTRPGDAVHAMLATRVAFADGGDPQLLGAYAVRQPGGRVAVLLVNKDPARTVRVETGLPGRLVAYVLGPAEYAWHARGGAGYARPDRGPRRTVVAAGGAVDLPPYSLAVVAAGGAA